MLRTSKERFTFFRQRHTTLISFAGMAELADALDSGSSGGDFVQVQVLLPAPKQSGHLWGVRFCFGGDRLAEPAQRLRRWWQGNVCRFALANDGRCPTRQTCRFALRNLFNLSCYPHQNKADTFGVSAFYIACGCLIA